MWRFRHLDRPQVRIVDSVRRGGRIGDAVSQILLVVDDVRVVGLVDQCAGAVEDPNHRVRTGQPVGVVDVDVHGEAVDRQDLDVLVLESWNWYQFTSVTPVNCPATEIELFDVFKRLPMFWALAKVVFVPSGVHAGSRQRRRAGHALDVDAVGGEADRGILDLRAGDVHVHLEADLQLVGTAAAAVLHEGRRPLTAVKVIW